MAMKKTKKRILILLSLLLLFLATVSANGDKARLNSDIKTSKSGSESIDSQRNYDAKEWAILNEKGDIEYVEARSGESAHAGAIGVRYKKNGKIIKQLWYTQETTLIGSWIDTIATAIDQITYYLIMAIHPFPSTMFQLYDTNIGGDGSRGYTMKATSSPDENWQDITINNFNSNYLLISNNYYNAGTLATNKTSSSGGGKWVVPIAESATDGGIQKSKWSVITVLFVTFFVAEVLFTSIWGYVTGSTENVLKETAKKAGITLALFILVSALPFLVEAMRFGFFSIADTFYGTIAEEYYNAIDMNVPLKSPGEVFQLPGEFMRKMKVFFVASNSEMGERALSATLGDDNSKGVLTGLKKIFIWLLYTVFRFFMFFAVLKGTLHIAVNILEVYLLLGVTMILVPFSIFEPLKPIGAKCVMSLATNLVECFIIVVILTCIVPAVIVVCSSMLNGIDASNNDIAHSYALVDFSSNYYGAGYNAITWSTDKENARSATLSIGDNFILFTSPLNTENKIGFVYRDSVDKGANPSAITQSSQESDLLSNLGVDVYFVLDDTLYENATNNRIGFDSLKGVLKVLPDKNYSEDTYFKKQGQYSTEERKQAVEKIAYGLLAAIKTLRTTDSFLGGISQRTEFLKKLTNSLLVTNNQFASGLETLLYRSTSMNQEPTPTLFNDTSSVKGFSDVIPFSAKIYNQSYTVTMFLQLTVIFMGMYIPVFFVQQSTQITNSLINGTAAMESFANALGGQFRTTTAALKEIGKQGMSIAGNVAKTATSMHNINTSQSTAQQTKSMAENMQSVAAAVQKMAEGPKKEGGDNGADSPGETVNKQ